MNWRSGTQVHRDEQTDEICILVRRIVSAVGDIHAAAHNTVSDPFEFAHPYLRRCLEQASAADPCAGANGLHLARIRGPVGTVLHTQSDVRSYSAPSDAIHPTSGPSSGSAYQSTWTGSSSEPHSPSSSGAVLGSDIADSSWMAWL